MEKTLDDKTRDRLSDAGSINMAIWMLSFIIYHFVKSDWFYLIYGLLAIALVNAAAMVSIFYKAYAKKDQLIRYKRIRLYFIFNCFMVAILIFLLILQISIHGSAA